MSVCLYLCQLIGSFTLYSHTLLTTYDVKGSTEGVQWVVNIEIHPQVASKSAKTVVFSPSWLIKSYGWQLSLCVPQQKLHAQRWHYITRRGAQYGTHRDRDCMPHNTISTPHKPIVKELQESPQVLSVMPVFESTTCIRNS